MTSPSSLAGTTPGWCSSPSGAPVGPHRCGCVGCGQEKTSIRWPPSRFARASRQRGAGKPCPTFTFDAGYDPVQLGVALAGEDVGVLLRLRSDRTFYADPPPGPTGGRPRRHGTKFACDRSDHLARCLQLSGRPRMHTMGGCGSSAGAGSIPSPICTPSGARAKPARSSAGPSSDWRWSISPDRPKLLCHSGSGGGDRSRRIWKPSGGCMSLGSRSNTPFASSNRSSSGRPPSSAHPRRRTAGPGW